MAESRDQSRRVGAWWGGSLARLGADLLERQPDALGEHDEARCGAAPAAGTGGVPNPHAQADQAALLVEAKAEATPLRRATSPIGSRWDGAEAVRRLNHLTSGLL